MLETLPPFPLYPYFTWISILYLPGFFFIFYLIKLVNPNEVILDELQLNYYLKKLLAKENIIILSLIVIGIYCIINFELPFIDSKIDYQINILDMSDCNHIKIFKSIFSDVKEYKKMLLEIKCNFKDQKILNTI